MKHEIPLLSKPPPLPHCHMIVLIYRRPRIGWEDNTEWPDLPRGTMVTRSTASRCALLPACRHLCRSTMATRAFPASYAVSFLRISIRFGRPGRFTPCPHPSPLQKPFLCFVDGWSPPGGGAELIAHRAS